MRSLVCSLILLSGGFIFVLMYIVAAEPRGGMVPLIGGSLLLAGCSSWVLFKFVEDRAISLMSGICASALIILSFAVIWNLLWSMSEYFYEQSGGEWIYSGKALGSVSRLDEAFLSALFFGLPVTLFLAFPFGWLLTAYKTSESE